MRHTIFLGTLALSVSLAVAGFAATTPPPAAGTAPATTTKAAATTTTKAAATPAPTKTLYDKLGGQKGVAAVVDDFITYVAADKRINKFFAKTDIPTLKQHLNEQLCMASGGGCTYTGRDMKTAHAGMGVATADFNALVADLGKSLTKHKVSKANQTALVAILAPMKGDIVEKP